LHLHHLTTMLLVTAAFLLSIVLHYSTVISRLSEHEKELAQRVAILSWQLERGGRSMEEHGVPESVDLD
jgi:hypothetical protein